MAKRSGQAFTMRTEWKTGATNAAWDELWRRIFAGPLRGFSLPAANGEDR